MLVTHRWFFIALAVCTFLTAGVTFGQPGSWGGWGGDRSGWGSRGPSGWGGDRGPGGWGGGPSWGGDRSSSFGGFRGPGGFPGGGFPGGGFPFGGGSPADMVRRADTNNNNTLEPDELQNGYGRSVRFMAERAGLNTNQPLRVDQVIAALDPSRSNSSSSGSSSPGSSAPNSAPGSQGFATQNQVALVPGFDNPPRGAGAAVGGATAAASQSNLPLEQRFDERILDRAKDRMREYDRDNNGFIEGDELANYRGDPPILTSDTNKDNKISLEEMAQRYQSRYSGSYGGGPGFPGGPGGPPGYGGYSSSGYPGSSSYSSSGYRPPYPSSCHSSTSTTSPSSSSSSYRPSYRPPGSTTCSSSSSNNDRFKELAQSALARHDRNGNGKLEKDEWV